MTRGKSAGGSWIGIALVVGLGALGLGCADRTPTQTVVRIRAETVLAENGDELHVQVLGPSGDVVADETIAIGNAGISEEVPILPVDGDADRHFVLRAEVLRDGFTQPMAVAEMQSGYVSGELRFVDLLLEDACIGVVCDRPGQTCHFGECVGSCFASGQDRDPEIPACGQCEQCVEGTCVPMSDGAACGTCDDDVCLNGACIVAERARQVAVGRDHACASAGDDESRRIYCWGRHVEGQLGTGVSGRTDPEGDADDAVTQVPTRVALPAPVSRVRSLAAGPSHTCVIDADTGTPYCWGDDRLAHFMVPVPEQLSRMPVPTPLDGLAGKTFSEIRTGSAHTCALSDQGELFCWGLAITPPVPGFTPDPVFTGATGCAPVDGEDCSEPTQIMPLTTWSAVAARGSHTCAATATGSLWCWGQTVGGQLGFGETHDDFNTAVPRVHTLNLGPSPTANSLAAGDSTTSAIAGDGTAWWWGSDDLPAETTPVSEPAPVSEHDDWTQVVSGGFHGCGLRSDRSAWCWRHGVSGALGNGGFDIEVEPQLVEGFQDWTSLAAGTGKTCGVRSNGSVWCWGQDRTSVNEVDTQGGVLGLGPIFDLDRLARPHRVCLPSAR